MRPYIVIVNTEDGCYISMLEKDELEKRLKDKYWGNLNTHPIIPTQSRKTEELPLGIYIIGGRVIMPEVVTSVVEYRLP